MVEHCLAKAGVAGSSPVSRSILSAFARVATADRRLLSLIPSDFAKQNCIEGRMAGSPLGTFGHNMPDSGVFLIKLVFRGDIWVCY